MATLVKVVIQSAPAIDGSDEEGEQEQADDDHAADDRPALERRQRARGAVRSLDAGAVVTR